MDAAADDRALPVDAHGGADSAADDAGFADSAGEIPLSDCSAIAASWQLCETWRGSCSAVFDDGAGCTALCAAAGMLCAAVYEDLEGLCAPDLERAELSCAPATGHQSDYCVCVDPAGCQRRCDGRQCGPDGCGGTCGTCSNGTCVAGVCRSGPVEDCSGYPFRADTLLAERVGFGRRAVGGDPANIYRVTTRADSGSGSLRAALESDQDYWIAFDVEGLITIEVEVFVRSNKTIDGRGRDVTIDGNLRLDSARNIIISDVHLTNSQGERCVQEGDVVTVSGPGASAPADYESRDIWLHHLDMYGGGDGLFDVRGGSRITASWCHFHDHNKGFLIGMQSAGELEGREQELTFHHNLFERITKRGPFVTYGRLHLFNNHQLHWWEWGARSCAGAQLLSEGNVWEARPGTVCTSSCTDPNECGDTDYLVDKRAVIALEEPAGHVRSTGDLLRNGAAIETNQPALVFAPDYAYLLEEADESLIERLRLQTGPRTGYCR